MGLSASLCAASAGREGAALGAGRTRGGTGLRGATGGRRRAESALCGAFRRTHRRWSPASSSRGLAPLGHTPAAGGRGTSSLPRRRGPGRGIGPPRAKPDIGDRVIASVPYLLPLLDGLRYGKFFFREFPQTYVLLAPLEPLIKAYYTLPFASLVVFFGLYYGIVQNYNFSRFVRFQAMQTILLDILLIIPSLLENFLLRDVPKSGAYLQILMSAYNFVWLYVLVCFLYGVASCLAGEQARLPGVADAADRQVM